MDEGSANATAGKELKRARKGFLKLEGIESKADTYRPEGMFDRSRYWKRQGHASGKIPLAPASYWSGEDEWVEGMWLRDAESVAT